MKGTNKKNTVFNLILAVASAFILAALPAMAQGQQSARQRDPLAGLERALQAAGAPAITPSEQASIIPLISQFKPVPPSGSAVQTLEAAILAGSTPDTTQIASNMATNLQNRASFASQVAGILNSNSQLTPLVTKFGTSRVVQLLESILGGGFGARSGFGMMGQRAR
jgi:hypothetical protein